MSDQNRSKLSREAVQPGPEQYQTELHRFLMRRLRSAEDANDLAQEVFLRFLQLPHAELIHNPRAYLYRVAANIVYEHRMRESRRDVPCGQEVLEQMAERAADGRDAGLEQAVSTSQQLERVLQQLPSRYRAVLLLQKRDGLSYAEVAATLGLSIHTVQKYLFRALASCRAAKWDSPD